MKNIIEYMYNNIKNKEKIIAEYIESVENENIYCLKSRDIIRFIN